MEAITKEKVQKAISDFFDKKSGLTLAKEKLDKANQALEKEQTKNNPDSVKIGNAQEKVNSALKEIETCEEIRAVKFAKDVWIENAAKKMSKQLKFGTLISKAFILTQKVIM